MQVEMNQAQDRLVRGMAVQRILNLKRWIRECRQQQRKHGQAGLHLNAVELMNEEREQLEKLMANIAEAEAVEEKETEAEYLRIERDFCTSLDSLPHVELDQVGV